MGLKCFSVANPFHKATPAPYSEVRIRLDGWLTVPLLLACIAYAGVSIGVYVTTPPNISFSVSSISVDVKQSLGAPLFSLWITGPPSGQASCGVNATWWNTFGLGLTTAGNPVPPQQSFEYLITDQDQTVHTQSGIFIPVYGTVDTNYLNIVGMVIPPPCAGPMTYVGVSAPPNGFDPTQYTFVTAKNDHNFPITLLQGNVYSATINRIPKQTLQIQSNTLVQITLTLIKQVKLDGSISYQTTMSAPVTIAPLFGYPTPALVIAMTPSVTVQTEQRESVLVLVGSITGAWSAIFAAFIVLENLLWKGCCAKQVAAQAVNDTAVNDKAEHAAAADGSGEENVAERSANVEMQPNSAAGGPLMA